MSANEPVSAASAVARIKLKLPRSGFRLRCGDYRAFFDYKDETAIEITGIRNRREAYR